MALWRAPAEWGHSLAAFTAPGKRGISHGDMIDLMREDVPGFDVREFYIGLVKGLKAQAMKERRHGDKSKVLCTALRQSAIDSGCSPEGFTRPEHVVVRSRANPAARRYLQLPFLRPCLVWQQYGGFRFPGNRGPVRVCERPHAGTMLETPGIYWLNEVLAGYGVRVHHMAEYFLPDVTALHAPCRYETRLLWPAEFAAYYTPQWANALCAQRARAGCAGHGGV